MRVLILFLAASALLLSSCIKNNPDPSWIYVGNWTLEDNPSIEEGELTVNFTDAWVYIDDKFVGVFETPFKIPYLESGEHKITLYPTVLNNGISATKKIYPFVEPLVITTNLVQNETLVIEPTTRYYSNVQFTIIDFEDANPPFEDSPSSLANIEFSNDPAIIESFNGNAFGRVNLTSTDYTWAAATIVQEDLPGSGAEVYVEIDYHNTADILQGVLAINSSEITQNPNVQMNKQESYNVRWKKIYIDIKEIVSGSPSATSFKHSFESTLPSGASSAQVNIDNIKVVRFQ